MKNRKMRKHINTFTAMFVTFLMVAPNAFSLSDGLNIEPHVAFAETSSSTNKVYFTASNYDTNDSNIIYATLRFEGKENSTIVATYKTYSGTAIENIDYQGITNSVSVTIQAGQTYSDYQVAIKCLNDNNSRETIRVYEEDQNYGRYFSLEIVSVSNAEIGEQKSCKCYLPYDFSAEATTGGSSLYTSREVAYLNDYKTMFMQFCDGKELDGREYYKTWKHGASFNNDTTKRWVDTFIQKGLAEAYGSFVVKDIDDMHGFLKNRDGKVEVCAGNGEFIEKFDQYPREKSCPGQYLYVKVDPPGKVIDGTAMYHMARWVNPYNKDDDLVDVDIRVIGKEHAEISWIVDESCWFSSKNSLYTNTFYKIDPYNGVLDMGVVGFDCNNENNMDFKKIWQMMTLYDHSAPQITKEYCEFDARGDGGKGAIRIYLRFNEPVYTAKKYDLSVMVNNYNHVFDAKYIEGNYSDTLVYEVPYTSTIPGQTSISNLSEKITSISYQLPNEDIGDMAYNMDSYKDVQHNLATGTDTYRSIAMKDGGIDLSKPLLNVDTPSSDNPNNVYDIMLSANDNGNTNFVSGVVYYKIDTDENNVNNPNDPNSYDNAHVLTSEEQGSFTITLAKNGSSSISSGIYYIHALAVSDYGFTNYNTFGPYRLDVDDPVIAQNEPTANELQYKEYVFEVHDKPLGTAITDINMVAKYNDMNGAEQISRFPIMENGVIPASLSAILSSTYEDGKTTYTYRSNLDESSSVPIDTFISGIKGESSRLNVEIYFEVKDAATNKAKTNSIRTVYDTRSLFENTVTPPSSYVEKSDIAVGCKVYDISAAAKGDGITFTVKDADPITYVTGGATYSLEVNDKTYVAEAGEYSITLSDLGPGYYKVTGYIKGTYSETEIDMVSKTTYFYLTNNYQDDTANKTSVDGNLVLTNHVYQLEDAQYYYYDSNTDKVASHAYGATLNTDTEKYEGGSTTPTFSSNIEAKKYVKYMEYQDLHLIKINDTIASLLNNTSGSTAYVKADGETTYAQSGQLWIRYKRSSWTNSLGTNGWVFYYYGNGEVSDGININGLSTNLNAAIEAVTNRIVSSGKELYLVEENNLNTVTYAPYLAESQMHVDLETISTSKSGDIYVTNPSYNGDKNLYQNNVTINEKNYPIATNVALSVSEDTLLYYRYLEADSWTQLNVSDGELLKTALDNNVTGPYTIREYDKNGVSEFDVYVDNTLPVLNVIFNSGIEGEYAASLDGSILSFSCTNLSLQSFANEADPLAYIAIYSYPNRALKTVLYATDLSSGGYLLNEGNFYVQVGDRSGNIATYTVLTSTSGIDISASENQTNTAIIVKINNREESEIYSYEVYLNEVLVDNEFATTKTYREAGLYRIQVTDIYGNSEVITIAHENPSPELTWYYLNDNGGYSVYDANKPVRMILEDSTTIARTTNVYASTLVRVLISSVYESGDTAFEITGIAPGDYSYNDLTGLLTINTLSSWTLKVWYTNQSNSEHIYIFTLDNNAPEVNGSFIGTPVENVIRYDESGNVVYISSLDGLDLDQYEEGDVISLDGLEYTVKSNTEIYFANESIISANRAVISVGDQSGIRSVEATRNGNPIEVALNENNQLILNSYGEYVITVTDNLSNFTIFKFVNVEGAVSKATVDEKEITLTGGDESGNNYGNTAIEVKGLYNGDAWIVITDDNNSDTYIFNYDGKVLKYGQYFITLDIYIDDQGVEHKDKVVTYVQNADFALYADDLTNLGRWYNVIEDTHYVISAMIDETLLVHLKVSCIDEEIRTEVSYKVGSAHLPDRYVATLSKELPSIILLSDGKEIEIKGGTEYTYIADDLSIDVNSVSSNISKIEYSYAKLPEFETYKTIYENGEWLENFVGKEEGFYHIVVTNKYGGQTNYNISKIQAFVSKVTIHTLDGSDVTYNEHEGTIYSNYSIDLIVYGESIYFEVNGKITSGYYEDGVATLSLTRDGQYEVSVIGENGVREDFNFEIKTDESFLYDESWITGYNEKALLREQGYTNQMCSIEVGKDVVFIDMVINDEDYVALYDNITADRRTDLNVLENAIGRYGVGKYVVGFRNKYGDLVTKTVYYNNEPSLSLQRITTNNAGVYQDYALSDATNYGFYSNYILIFSTKSETYKFTINDVSYRLDQPKRIEFTNASGIGSFSYVVTYLDEYGNYVEFNAILYRADVEYDASLMKTTTLNSSLYTRDDISISFKEGLKATVSVDEGEAVDYSSGKILRADGKYTFVIRDVAGNIATYVINHKSINHYSLTTSSSDAEVIAGGVVNNGSVVFTPQDDSRIKYVVKNGELITEINSNTFTTTGHYELIIEDNIGNQSYEEFYIINNSLCEFNYNAPYTYEITEVWRINENGSRDLMNYRGPSIYLDEKGNYLVVVTSTVTTSSYNFSISIDRTLPTAELVGAENSGVTASDVTLTGLKVGDMVKIYRDDKLISSTEYTLSSDAPKISESGRYRLLITNVQGMSVEYTFTRKAISNVAGSIFIIVSSSLLVVGIGIGLIYHTKLKTDD